MLDKTLIKISIACSIIGLISLSIISSQLKPETMQIEKIADNGDEIAINGIIDKVTENQNLTMFTVGYYTSINVVIFEAKNLSIGDSVEVQGKVSEYKGKKEIVCDKIIKK